MESRGRLPVAALQTALLNWYEAHARPLPWRRTRDPYRVWVAEVMLQQTRVAVVVPAYQRFLRAFPSLGRLAGADEERVLSLWSGLGYYSRARALHRAARTLHALGERTFPNSAEAARRLPGVGPYTAAAVLSIAYGLPHAALDGNVMRVLSRLGCLPPPDGRGEPQRSCAERLLPHGSPGDWNQALMELGQTVCLPRAPRCQTCPVGHLCHAYQRNAVARFPARRPRRTPERIRTGLLIVHDRRGRLLLERGVFPYLDHLWLPLVRPDPAAALAGMIHHGSFRHAIQDRLFEVEVWSRVVAAGGLRRRVAAQGGIERRVFARAELSRIGRSALLTKALAAVARHPRLRAT